jgi:two-component system, chemotaxis family, protein-glutamate methylesterase/glutaminase
VNDVIRVLVVDDTVTFRKVMSQVVEALDGTELVGTAANGAIALDKIPALQPDLVLMDIVMPQMDGLTALREIRVRHPDLAVVMVSSHSREDADVTMRALAAGALDFIPKPAGQDMDANLGWLLAKVRPILHLVRTRRYTAAIRGAGGGTPEAAVPVRTPEGRTALRPGLVAIGVSTGGPRVLNEIFQALTPALPVPVLLVQHMPPIFTASLAEHITAGTGFPMHEGVHGEPVLPGRAYIAPGGRHMEVRSGRDRSLTVEINDRDPVYSCRPSVDVLLRSLAAYGPEQVLAVVLTGMGRDGTDGLTALKAARRCHCLIQDESSSVVFGMPKAVQEAGLADEVLPGGLIGARINALVRGGR